MLGNTVYLYKVPLSEAFATADDIEKGDATPENYTWYDGTCNFAALDAAAASPSPV